MIYIPLFVLIRIRLSLRERISLGLETLLAAGFRTNAEETASYLQQRREPAAAPPDSENFRPQNRAAYSSSNTISSQFRACGGAGAAILTRGYI